MKTKTHPVFYNDAIVSCVCGNTFTTGSTKKQITVEVCYKCHPLYTGEQRFVDIKGRVETFQKKQTIAQQYKTMNKNKKKNNNKEEKQSKSLKELLGEF